MSDNAREGAAALMDTLLPGAGVWPAASTVVDPDVLPASAVPLGARLAALPLEARAEALAGFEAEAPEAFAALYFAVADAYYATPEVAAVVAHRASSGPADEAGFDPDLLRSVRRHGRGRRRL